MVSAARAVSYELLSKIEMRGALSDYALNSRAVSLLEVLDRNLTTEIVYGTLRWQALLDFVLMRVTSRPWEKVEPAVKVLLRMSLYQMWMMDRIPDHALVHDAVELSRRHLKRGTESFINGVLRRVGRERPWATEEFEKETPPWIRVSLPAWLWERWESRFGRESAWKYALSLNQPPQAVLRRLTPTGRASTGPCNLRLEHLRHPSSEFESCHVAEPRSGAQSENTLMEELEDSQFCRGARQLLPPAGERPSELVPGAVLLEDNRRADFQRAPFLFQDEASQLVPHLLGPISGASFWDACAAPGGKSAILRSLCGREGRLISTDRHFPRARRLKRVLEDSAGASFDVLVVNASLSPPFRKPFDGVLADVPCSGLGTLRRNPEIKWRIKPERLALLHSLQKEILEAVASAVRVGGVLLYSTCSTEPEENEEVVDSFLHFHPSFSLAVPSHPPGIEAWILKDGMVRTFPTTRLWDGFFAALMVRKA